MKKKEDKQREAKERQEAYDKMNLEQKIEKQIDKGYKGKELEKLMNRKQENLNKAIKIEEKAI